MTEEASVWLQTRRILQRRERPSVGQIKSTAPREHVEAWMHDEITRWKKVDALFRAQKEGR